jgi:hypothetical protein
VKRLTNWSRDLEFQIISLRGPIYAAVRRCPVLAEPEQTWRQVPPLMAPQIFARRPHQPDRLSPLPRRAKLGDTMVGLRRNLVATIEATLSLSDFWPVLKQATFSTNNLANQLRLDQVNHLRKRRRKRQ